MQEGNPWMKHRGRDERLGGTSGVEERLGSAIKIKVERPKVVLFLSNGTS
jgi:hypothetical protein